MKAILVTVMLLAAFGYAGAQNDLYLKTTIERLRNAKTYTLQMAEKMPEKDYNFKPTPDEMTFGKMLLHMAENLVYISSQYVSESKNPMSSLAASDTSKAGISKAVASAYDFAITAVTDLRSEQLADSVVFFAGKLTKMQMVNILNDHQAHHRGQLVVYLRLNGIVPPRYIGW